MHGTARRGARRPVPRGRVRPGGRRADGHRLGAGLAVTAPPRRARSTGRSSGSSCGSPPTACAADPAGSSCSCSGGRRGRLLRGRRLRRVRRARRRSAASAPPGCVLPLGGAALVLGWLFLPLVFFGVDESLDPARFALLPLRRRTLIAGLFAAALAGLPALSTLVATIGMVRHRGPARRPRRGRWPQLVGVVLGLLLCVAVSRAGDQRVRHRAALAAVPRPGRHPAGRGRRHCSGRCSWRRSPASQRADWDTVVGAGPGGRLDPARRALLARPGRRRRPGLGRADQAADRRWPPSACCCWWWSPTLETRDARHRRSAAAAGARTAAGAHARRPAASALAAAHPVRRAGRPRGALLVARDPPAGRPDHLHDGRPVPAGRRSHDQQRRARRRCTIFVGALAAVGLANQFGFEGSAYAANLVAGVPGRLEVQSRATAHALYVLPVLAGDRGAGRRRWPAIRQRIPGTVRPAGRRRTASGWAWSCRSRSAAAYALPDSANPFALSPAAASRRACSPSACCSAR